MARAARSISRTRSSSDNQRLHDHLAKLTADAQKMPNPEDVLKAIRPELNKIFKPAFLAAWW